MQVVCLINNYNILTCFEKLIKTIWKKHIWFSESIFNACEKACHCNEEGIVLGLHKTILCALFCEEITDKCTRTFSAIYPH